MPGMTLVGEATAFAPDQDLINCCPDNPDEPAGDDFETRCRNKLMGGAWIDPQVGYITQEDIEDMFGIADTTSDADDAESEGDDEGYDPDDEVRGIRACFCAMTPREQNRFIAKEKLRICEMIGVSYFDWEPSDEFILEIIEDETPDAAIYEMARAAYLATPVPFEDNPSDEDVGPGLDEEDDLIRIGQGSRERGLPNIGWRNLDSMTERRDHRRGPRTMKSRRPKSHSTNCRSHCPKYGRQDYRHQAPRIEAKYERRFAAYEAEVEAYYQAVYYDSWDNEVKETNFTEAEMVALDERFGFSDSYWDYVDFLDREIYRKMEEMARDFGYVDDICDIAGTRGYMPGDFKRRGYYGPDRFGGYLGFGLYADDYDPYDDYAFDGYDRYADHEGYDDPEPCRCAECAERSEHQRLADRFGDWYDDLDFDYFCGPTEADIDAVHFGQSNSKRRTYHLRELMERRITVFV